MMTRARAISCVLLVREPMLLPFVNIMVVYSSDIVFLLQVNFLDSIPMSRETIFATTNLK